MKNLLIDGMPGCGKTTAISDALRELGLLPFCAGFRTVRVLSADGKHLGFAQLPASTDAGVDVVSEEPLPHMIMDFRGQQGLISEVFTDFTVGSLKHIPAEAAGAGKGGEKIRLILMDEIGGAELKIPQVCGSFLEALKGPVPCIGVIKNAEHAKTFAYESYLEFRRRVEAETDTEFLYMDETNRDNVRRKIGQWLTQLTVG